MNPRWQLHGLEKQYVNVLTFSRIKPTIYTYVLESNITFLTFLSFSPKSRKGLKLSVTKN